MTVIYSIKLQILLTFYNKNFIKLIQAIPARVSSKAAYYLKQKCEREKVNVFSS